MIWAKRGIAYMWWATNLDLGKKEALVKRAFRPFDSEMNRKWEGKGRGRGAAGGKINTRRQVEREDAAAAAAAAAAEPARASSKYSKLPSQSSKLSRYFFFFFFFFLSSFCFSGTKGLSFSRPFRFFIPSSLHSYQDLIFYSPIICNTKNVKNQISYVKYARVGRIDCLIE